MTTVNFPQLSSSHCQSLKVTSITLPIFSDNELCIYRLRQLLRSEKNQHFPHFAFSNTLRTNADSSEIRPFVMSQRTVKPQR